MALRQLSFLHTLFLENIAQINKINYATVLFVPKQVSLPKISSILQKYSPAGKPSIEGQQARTSHSTFGRFESD